MDWSDQHVESTEISQSVSACILRAAGGEVVACRRGIAIIDSGEARLRVAVESHRMSTRINDAKCDPAGRLWVGTMADDERPGAGSLYRVDSDSRCVKILSDITIANGLGWSPDGRSMYFIDSPTRSVDVFTLDVATGDATCRHCLIDTSEFQALPDGMAVDAEGCTWVAFYGGSAIRRFSPDGALLGVVDVPTPDVTSCAFAGTVLDHLVITTARAPRGDGRQRGGDVFVAVPGFEGQPTIAFAG